MIPNIFFKTAAEHCVSLFPQHLQKRGTDSKAAEVNGRLSNYVHGFRSDP